MPGLDFLLPSALWPPFRADRIERQARSLAFQPIQATVKTLAKSPATAALANQAFHAD